MGKPVKLKKKNKVRSYVAGLFDMDERLTKLSLLRGGPTKLDSVISDSLA